MIKISLSSVLENPTLATLSWEIVEARGVACGDLMALWRLAVALLEQVSDQEEQIEEYSYLLIENPEGEEEFKYLIMLLVALNGFMIKEAGEIIKFLHERNFEFPPENLM